MNQNRKLQRYLLSAIIGLALVGAAKVGLAQGANDYVVDKFDDDTTITSWGHDWGNPSSTIEFDPAQDAAGSASSGAIKFTVNYDVATYGGNNDCAFQRVLSEALDMSAYTNIHLKIKVDPSSSHLSGWGNGALGNMSFYMRDPSWTFKSLGDKWIDSSAYGTWTDVVMPIDQLKLDTIANNVLRWGWQMWSGWGDVGHTNTVTYWVDNVWFEYNTNTAPPPPPTLNLAPTTSGLQLIASALGSRYQRQSIRTVNPVEAFVGASSPITYSLTIKSYPDAAHPGFQTHIFIAPGTPGNETAPDWNEANIIFLDIQNQASGAATATFRFKTNQPGGNSQIYGSGAIASLTSPSILGTWSLTLSNENVTLAGADGSKTNFTLPADALSYFADTTIAYFGAQPNQLANIGQAAVLSHIKITGPTTAIDDTFPGPDLDSAIWQKSAENPPGVLIAPAGSSWWLGWTLPDTGFALQASPTVAPATWADSATTGLTNILQIGAEKKVLIPAGVPGASSGYFRLIKQ